MTFFTPPSDIAGVQRDSDVNPDLPMVMLIGDSISIGYTAYVRNLLKGKVNVVRPNENCGDTANGLKNITQWLGDYQWDLIHFNWGLHDLCYRHPDSKVYGNRDKVNGVVSVEISQYKENLKLLIDTLRIKSKYLIWASTTFIPEGEAGRHQGDEKKYNEVAATLMKNNDITINDLWSLTRSFDESCYTCKGDVHFTPEAYLTIAREVSATIENKLTNPSLRSAHSSENDAT